MPNSNIIPLLMAAQLAQHLGQPASKIQRLIKSGRLVPDFQAGERFNLFQKSRLPEIQVLLNPALEAQ